MIFIPAGFPLNRRLRRLRARGKLTVSDGRESAGGGGDGPPKFRKIPTEVFCFPFSNTGGKAQAARKNQRCRILGGECDKPRKSEPHVKVGVCSVGYRGSFRDDFSPVAVCPRRLQEKTVFADIARLYIPQASGGKKRILWVKEVSMGVGGSVDYVAFIADNNGGVRDFLCVEFQAAGTTGTPWDAVVALREGRPLRENYNYGVNWANEFLKTMMQQAFKKGKIVAAWGRKIVFVIQDIGLEYIRNMADDSALREARDEDPVHFCTFKMQWAGGAWKMVHDQRVSTDMEGIAKILGGATVEDYPTVDDFKRSIRRKAEKDKVIRPGSRSKKGG